MQLVSPTPNGHSVGRRFGRSRTVQDDAVFRAVFAVVADVGYPQLTFAKLGDRVGLTPSALVQRFGNKRRLLLAFFDWIHTMARALIDASLVDVRAQPVPALRSALATWSSQLPAQPERLAHLLAFFPTLAGDKEMSTRIARIDGLLEETIDQVLRSAAAHGDLKAVDPRLLARTLIATCRGTLLRWVVLPEGPLPDQLGQCVGAVLAPYLAEATT